jgi:endonuclease/exonuclease/phosphatase family metal-dependent hydrolase
MQKPTTLQLLLIIVALFTTAACKKKDNPTTGNFTVLTYNVAGLPDQISGSTPSVYSEPIGLLINDYDIVHVQEDFCYHDSLLLKNTHPYRTETLGCIFEGDGLNTFSKYPINSNFSRTQWNHCADADCFTPKGFSYSQIEISKGVWVDFYNVHANAQSYEEALEARRNNIMQLHAYINEHSKDKPVIVMGDMNCRYTREGDNIRLILELGFKDSWIELIRNGSIPEKGASALTDCDVNRTSATCEKVDKIFYRSSNKVKLKATEFKMDDERFYYEGNDTIPLSDHYPVYTKFSYEISE